jgi:hypothetical protein
MDDVRVHYNSPKPAQLQALAYTQGTDIHVAPGQEKHLPHEAWHVVQQKQGRVQPTMQLQGVNVNDNEGLEREADVMGGRAIQRKERMKIQSQQAKATLFNNSKADNQVTVQQQPQQYKCLNMPMKETVQLTKWKWDGANWYFHDKEDDVPSTKKPTFKPDSTYKNQIYDDLTKKWVAMGADAWEEIQEADLPKIEYENDNLEEFVKSSPDIKRVIEDNIYGGARGTPQRQQIGGFWVCHHHIGNGNSIAFRWTKEGILHISAYGTKKDSAKKGTGGYKWDVAPK